MNEQRNVEDMKMGVRIGTSMRDGIQTLAVEGSFVYQYMKSAKEQTSQLMEDAQGYILDFTRTSKIDSTGFGLLINLFKRKPEGARMVAVVSNSFIRELFDITKIDKLMDVFGTMDEAVKNVRPMILQSGD